MGVVTGEGRGAGRGIASALGGMGALLYVTGRSVGDGGAPHGVPIHEAADLVTSSGGRGVAVAVDHEDDGAVAALFERVKAQHGRMDVLVNNAAKLVSDPAPGGFWEKPVEATEVITVGLRSHFVAAYYAAPLLITNGHGLIVNTGYYGAVSYHFGPAYGAQKAGADKMAADMAKELRPFNVAAISIWMGPLDTEHARAYLAKLPEDARPNLRRESPQFTGRRIAALYGSDQRMKLSGYALIGAELGTRLGVTDIDGTVPLSYRYEMGGPPEPHMSLVS